MMDKIAVLFNPSSGKGRSLKEKRKIERILEGNAIDYDLFVSDSEEHLKTLAAEVAGQYRKYRVIVGVGGDTTFNIAAAEILKHDPAPAMGMIGTGSANDIVRGLGIHKIEDSCKAIKQGNTKKMDVGHLKIKESSFFLGTLSAGLGTTVNRYVEQFHQNHGTLSKLPFFNLNQSIAGLCGIYNSFSAKKLPLKGEIHYTDSNGGKKMVKGIEFSLLVFLNTPYYANGLKLTAVDTSPAPTLFDGLLDCCIIHTTSFLHTFKIGMKVQKGRHIGSKEVTMLQSPSFKIFLEKPGDIQVDGEIIEGIEEFEVSVIPGKLKVLC